MTFEVYSTTAVDIVNATDAVLLKRDGADPDFIAEFLDVPVDNAQKALSMAAQLGLIEEKNPGNYIPCCPYAIYLVTSVRENKAAILRLVLENYPPYKTFKIRLMVTGVALEAASQTRATHKIKAYRGDILNTFVSLGTYTKSLIHEGAELYRPAESEPYEYLSILQDAIQNKEYAESVVRKRLGAKAAAWIEQEAVLDQLVIAYQKAAAAGDDPRSPVLYAGNAIESFLAQLGNYHQVNLQNANGINAKADRLAQANRLTKKHKFVVKYLGHVRNAADHGVDQEIQQPWSISETTSVEFVHVSLSIITATVASLHGKYIV